MNRKIVPVKQPRFGLSHLSSQTKHTSQYLLADWLSDSMAGTPCEQCSLTFDQHDFDFSLWYTYFHWPRWVYISIYILKQQLGPKIKDTSLVLMKLYIFICARIQRKNKYTFSNVKTLFALLVTHKEKRQSRIPVNLKTPNSHQPMFRPEVPPAPSTWKRPVREAKFNLKYYTSWNKVLHLYGSPKISNTYFSSLEKKKSDACYGTLVGTSLVSASHNTTSLWIGRSKVCNGRLFDTSCSNL